MSVPISSSEDDRRLSPFGRILVAIDGSEASLRAARVAIQMAAVHSLPLTTLYVIDETVIGDITAASGESTDQVRRQLEEKGWHYLEYVSHIARNHGVTCRRLMREGLPHGQIADVVWDFDIDLLVIGRKGLQSSRRAFLDSVTERAIEYAPCSVLIVKSE
ncbi:MAG: universal stress protein [Anaerolineae bacterium]